MKNENFKKRLALALVPILSLTSVIGNVPILPTSVFAVTQDEVYIEEPMVIEEETLEVEEPAEVEEPEALLNEVPEDLQNLSVVNKDALNEVLNPNWTVTWAIPTNGSFTVKESETTKTSPYAYANDSTEITVAFTPDEGYELDTFTIDGVAVDVTENNWTGTLAGKDAGEDNGIVLAATFKEIPVDPPAEDEFTISWTVGTGGTLKIGTDDTSPYTSDGTEIIATITPPAGNRTIKTFTVAGSDKKSDLKNGTSGTKHIHSHLQQMLL